MLIFIQGMLHNWHINSFINKASKTTMFKWLLLMYGLHVISMMYIENMSFNDANWLTMTTMVTVGYGDLSAKTVWGRIATIVFMYGGGIFVLANAVSMMIEVKSQMASAKLSGQWRWNLKNHILIISPIGNETIEYFVKLVKEIRLSNEFKDSCIQLLSPSFDTLPERLKEYGVVHYKASGNITDDLIMCNSDYAKAVIVLGDNRHHHTDALVFDIVSRLQPESFVIAECVDDTARDRFAKVGANVIVRPARGYPEIIARGLVSPGTEKVMEEIFSGDGRAIIKIDFEKEISFDFNATASNIADNDIGILIGACINGEMTLGPLHEISSKTIYLISDQKVSAFMIRGLLKEIT